MTVGIQRALTRVTVRLRWNVAPDHGIRHRVFSVATNRPWWNWGKHLTIVVGRAWGGTYDEPQPETWWYRLGPPTRQRRTGFPRHPLRTYQIVKDYAEFRSLTDGLNEDQMYEWQAIYVNQDGELSLGHRYWGGNFYGLSKSDVALLRRYLRHWRRIDWWGLRSWLYWQGLHASVYSKKPFSCGAHPGPGHGGYDHWSCRLSRKHEGLHRTGNYVWGEINGEPIGATYAPAVQEAGQ